ncbi:nucleotide sugar dehydrogenase [Candidatus Babeliales bacterium]|nr:nucleotide sugar dehydrogenase [Candidatus Babeliales bacterium]
MHFVGVHLCDTRVSVLGLGYIGLPTAIIAANSGFQVFGFDINISRIKKIRLGDISCIEENLRTDFIAAIKSKKLIVDEALKCADYFIICVPTPLRDGKADLSAVWSAADSVSSVIKAGNVVVLESTVPVGTSQLFAQRIIGNTGLQPGVDFFVAHCPERVLPGKIRQELVENHRVIGGLTKQCADRACDFYKTFVSGLLHKTDLETAEMTKLIENSCRDVQIAFANQVADMCDDAGVNAARVIELANEHPRVSVLNPGPGVGGHCVAVDPQFLINSFPQSSALLQVSRVLNDSRPRKISKHAVSICKNIAEEKNKAANVLVLGLTYKPDVDDIRESPALSIAQSLNQHENICLKVCDPNVEKKAIEKLGFSIASDWENMLGWADVVMLLVPHKAFSLVSKRMLDGKIIVDPTGFLEKKEQSAISNREQGREAGICF